MRQETIVQKFCFVCCTFVVLPLFCSQSAFSTPSNTCGPMGNKLCILTVDAGASRPVDATTNVPIEKGKRPGLLFRLKCVGFQTSAPKSDACFPIQSSGSTVVQITIGNASPINCTTPGPPAINSCSYTLVDVRGPSTCGPSLNEPCPGPPSCGTMQACTDTVKIVYNGDFPKNTPIIYSVGGAQPPVNGVTGVGGEIQNAANAVSFTTAGSTPTTVSLELVFDISGSMALPTITNGTVSRMKALKDAAQILLAPGGIVNSYAIPGDKLGVSFFTTTASPDQTTCTGTNLVGADNPTNVSNINNLIQTQNPTASTSIGAGLLSAKTCGFANEPPPQNANKQVLLFSDGAQNTLPNVVFPVVGNTIQTVDASNTITTYPNNINICPVTAGPLVPPALDLQQQIADAKCSGRNAHTPSTDTTFTGAYLETYFAQSLAAILPTDKLEIAVDTTGTIVRGKTSVEKFLGSANDVKMTIALSLSGTTDSNLEFTHGAVNQPAFPVHLKAPDGINVDLANRISFGRNIVFITIPFPFFQSGTEVGHGGEWQLSINGDVLRDPSMNYHLIVMEDNPTLVSDFSIDAQDVGTGEPIPIRVKLTDNGKPVLNANVQAQLMGPANSQGNILSTTPTPPPASPGPDPASTKGQAKLDALYKDPANANLFADKGLPTVALHDNANSGVYTGSFANTSNEGHYYFTVRARGTSAAAGDFQRTLWIARFVRSKPSSTNTVFKLLSYDPQSNGTALARLQAIPHDSLGNFLGPGYEKDMHIKSSAGTAETPLDDKLDGSYEITYRLPSTSSNPSFAIDIIGTEVKTETLHELQGVPPTPTPQGRFAVYADAGAGKLMGTLGSGFDTGFSFNAGLEFMATQRFSVEGIFGYHHFPVNSVAGAVVDDLNVYQFSANGKAYLLPHGPIRPFLNAGIGGYHFGSADTHFGGNVGAGVLFEINHRVGVQGSYNFHVVSTPIEATKFSTFQGGIRFVF